MLRNSASFSSEADAEEPINKSDLKGVSKRMKGASRKRVARKEPHPIEKLPFVATKKFRAWQRLPRCFWAVKNSSDYGADCTRGREFALDYLDYMASVDANLHPNILPQIVGDFNRPIGGLEIGFMTIIGSAAVSGIQEGSRLASHWSNVEKSWTSGKQGSRHAEGQSVQMLIEQHRKLIQRADEIDVDDKETSRRTARAERTYRRLVRMRPETTKDAIDLATYVASFEDKFEETAATDVLRSIVDYIKAKR